MSGLAVRGVWSGTGECGTSRDSVATFVARLADVGVNAIFMGIKEGDGRLCWPSERFPQAVKEPFSSFDLPAVLLNECSKRDIALHAWLIDYYEGEQGAAYREHPEWAALDAKGKPTCEEKLRGQRYSSAWMCAARRPGYTDQWLVPIYAELASRYEFASIHHDYIRYPGDLAPDQYCFCDYCLEEIVRFAGLISEAHPDEPFLHELYDREYLESHWEQSPRALPTAWSRWPRDWKAKHLLEGSFFQGGRADLDYFFYLFRTEHINRFARESYEAVKAINPKTKLSGAIFKNPVHSGRFIGQDWRQFGKWMEIAVPMDYRDHFPGTFEQYLSLLDETIRRQKVWAAEMESLWIGAAINFLFKEEPSGPYPAEKLGQVLKTIAATEVDGAVLFSSGQFDRYGIWDYLTKNGWA
ncbi:MAG: hypothetical protein H7Y17_00100 [Chlorobia bacterium]|nr:hypothetical protein [Fimbriimonadaceae bacterium]